jgi:cysteine-rich repeat protein
MARPWIIGASVLLLAEIEVASAKILVCPPGRFEIHDGGSRDAMLAGAFLRLSDDGMVEIEGVCAATPASGRFIGLGWHGRFKARFAACDGSSGVVRLRARLDDRCDALSGLMRSRSRRATFTANRAAVCGDLVVSNGEDCDDGNTASGDCCVACAPSRAARSRASARPTAPPRPFVSATTTRAARRPVSAGPGMPTNAGRAASRSADATGIRTRANARPGTPA